MGHIAIIPARSGSKGLKDKNILPLGEKPLMAYSIEAALKSNMFDVVMVSTDSRRYADIAEEYGAEVPFLRAEELSSDTAGSWDVVLDVLNKYRSKGKIFETITLLQPTSPLRTSDDIVCSFRYKDEKKADSITSVCEMEHSPLWANTLPEDCSMKNFIEPEIDNKPRQELPTYYRENGAIYIREITYDESEIRLESQREFAYIMEQKKSVDIDSEIDFRIAEVLMRN